jgi:PAS domain-containing protein
MSPVDRKLPLFEDADETVQAIHQGDVDAVVVMRALEGPQVILLQGAEEPYRVLVERMSDGALTAGPDGIILYVNDRLCELTGYPSSRLVGRDISSRVCCAMVMTPCRSRCGRGRSQSPTPRRHWFG